ncbi:MAG: YbaB/EbfC family nucleoid-associated protein [Patescibacteria group bacterium]|nr:YbaB/EbfC family nucleoid-associated protein [Patescibacteria group bacterium]
MFDKLKQLRELKALQDQMRHKKYEVSEGGITVVVNGNLILESLDISSDSSQNISGEAIKQSVNKAIKKAQQGMAQKLQGMNLGL